MFYEERVIFGCWGFLYYIYFIMVINFIIIKYSLSFKLRGGMKFCLYNVKIIDFICFNKYLRVFLIC